MTRNGRIRQDLQDEARAAHTKKLHAEMEKEWGGRAVLFSDPRSVPEVDPVSTGALTLDLAMGIGGFPRGRMIELSGNTGAGKTTLALSTAAQLQARGGVVGFLDVENALTRELVGGFEGIDPDRLWYFQPHTGEEAAEVALQWAASGAIDMIILDSVAALLPEAEKEADIDQHKMALLARLVSRFVMRVKPLLSEHQSTLILVNQLRKNISGYGPPEFTTGGMALEYQCDVRVKCRTSNGRRIKGPGNEIIGTSVDATVEKNKFAASPRTAVYDIIFGAGINRPKSVLMAAQATGAVVLKGSYYTEEATGETLGQGASNAERALVEDPELSERLEKAVWAATGRDPTG